MPGVVIVDAVELRGNWKYFQRRCLYGAGGRRSRGHRRGMDSVQVKSKRVEASWVCTSPFHFGPQLFRVEVL